MVKGRREKWSRGMDGFALFGVQHLGSAQGIARVFRELR
jgi:hypothetical protein